MRDRLSDIATTQRRSARPDNRGSPPGRFRLGTLAAAAGLFGVLGISPALATVITYTASGTATGGDGPLSASAQFTTSAGHLEVILTNLLGTGASGIRDVGQAVSDLSFTLSNNAGALGTTSASGQQGNISSTGVVTDVSGSPGRFIGVGGGGLTTSAGSPTVTLEAIGGGQPTELIFPFVANGSSFGNTNPGIDAHNPYTIGPGTFELNLAGVTAATTITAATFSFGTGPDTFLPGTPSTQVPEPASLSIFGITLIMLASIGYIMRRRREHDR